MSKTGKKIVELLQSTERKGIDNLIGWLVTEGFFTAPASTKYHGCYAGGLAEHSYDVYTLLRTQAKGLKLDTSLSAGQKPLLFGEHNLIIAALLHDICKVGLYLGTEKPYKWNKENPTGHAALSIERIKKFIDLEDIEEMMIRFHMNIYGCYEFYEKGKWDYKNAEYHLRGDHSKDGEMSKEESQAARYGKSLANACFHNPIVTVMYFADHLATLQEKAKEA